MAKTQTTAQYLKDKLILGCMVIKKRNIGVYMDDCINAPAISEELLSEISNEPLSSAYDKRQSWFERACKALSNSQFKGARRKIAVKLLEKQKLNPFSIDLVYRPKRLVGDVANRFSNVNDYYESLLEPYKLHIYEDSLSLLLSTIKDIAEELDIEDLTDEEFEFYVKHAERKFLSALWLDPGVTPEERKVIRYQAMKRLRENNEAFGKDSVSDFVQLRLNQDKLVGEIKAKFDPKSGYFGSRFSNMIHKRIHSTFERESNIESLDDETSDVNIDSNVGGAFNPTDGDFSSPEANLQAEFIFSTIDKTLSKEQRFLFRMKFVDEYSHEKIAEAFRQEFESKSETKATNIPYMTKQVLADLEKALGKSGIDDPATVVDGLISLLCGKKPKQ